MEKELTRSEALRKLSEENAKCDNDIIKKWDGKKMPGRDGAYTQELKALTKVFGERFFKLNELYQNHETLPESEVMKIVMGDF